jgi:hypothetical protein
MRALGAIAFVALAAAATANSPEPSPKTLAAVAATCTADGAFGFRFGQKNVSVAGWAGIPPFGVDNWSEGYDGLYEITAAASFAKAPMSEEDRGFLADWVFKKLAAAIAARKLLHRKDRFQGVAFVFDRVVFDISRTGTTVRLTCTDTLRKTREDARKAP